MEDELLYRGRFDHIGDRKLNSIRLFISSTFTDTTEERNGLIDRVYPRLREYCLTKYNIQFQYSDMRWGIQSTASNTHATVDMCLQELDVCCRLSMATNCVFLLSHRYGSRFAPACIPARLFQHLLSNAEDKILLQKLYQLDENYLDQKYFLRPIDNNHQWDESEKKLQIILRQAAERCYEQKLLTKYERDEFHISVTAQEIYRALANNKQKQRRMLCFFRELSDIDELESKFHDNHEDKDECEQLLTDVKEFLQQPIDSSDIYSYKLRWKNETDRKTYLSKFFDDFYHAVQSQIDYHMSIHENKRENLLYNQIFEHAIQCNLLIQRFFSRPDIFEQIKTYITSSKDSPCVLFGYSGTGKSSIMAKLVYEIPNWYPKPKRVSVIVRFLGVTPSSSDIRRPLISIIEQICHIYQWDIPSNFDHVRNLLENILSRIPKDEQLVLLLDSLDQLQVNDLTDLSKWLPENLHTFSNVKCIYSTISDIEIGMERKEIHIRQQLQTIYRNRLFEIEVKPFGENTAEQVLDSWLKQDRRCLTSTQHEWLKPKLTRRHEIDPLFLSLLYDQTLTWHSYDQTPDKAFLPIESIGDAIEYLYNQLGAKHGELLFHQAMHYLQLAGGLSELELEDILSLDDEVLQSVFVHYLPPLEVFRLPSNLWIRIRNDMHKYLIEKDIDGVPCIYFYHRTFQEYEPWKGAQGITYRRKKAVLEKNRLEYFANQYKPTFDMSYSSKLMKKYNLLDNIVSVNRCLSAQQPFEDKTTKQYNLRRLHQLYLNIGRYEYVHFATLFNLDFLRVLLLCGEFDVTHLLHQFTTMNYNGSGASKFLLKIFEISLDIIDQLPYNLAFELTYRLYPFREYLPELLVNLLDQCLNQCPLLLITDDQRQQYQKTCAVGKIIYAKISPFSLLIVNDDGKFYRFKNYFQTLISVSNIPYEKTTRDEKLVSALCQNEYLCCLTSNSQLISTRTSTNVFLMQKPCNRLISFIKNGIILLVSKSNHAVQIWDCSKCSSVSEYDFGEDIIEDCFLKKTVLKVSLKLSQTIVYLSIDDNQQLKLTRTIHQHRINYQHRILLDLNAEFFYSLDRLTASLIIYDETNPMENYNDIYFISQPKSVFYLPNSNSIAWLTDTSLIIFNPLYKEKIFQSFNLISSNDKLEYDVIQDNYSSHAFSGGLGNLLACIVKGRGIIDIYEWFYDKKQQKHVSYLLTQVKLDFYIDQCVFEAEHSDGITLYCLDGENIYKYNATMLSCLVASKPLVASDTILRRPDVHQDQFLTYTDKDQNTKVFTLNDENKLQFHLSIPSVKELYFTTDLSHVLVVNQKNSLSIHLLKTTKLLWNCDEFQHRKFQIHSLTSSFIILCIQTSKVFQIDTESFRIKILPQLSIDCSLSTLASNDRLILLSKDQTNILEFNLNNHKLTNRLSIQLNSSKVMQMYVTSDYLVFHNNNKQIYLWEKEKQTVKQLEDASHLKLKDNLLVLVSKDNKTIIFHHLQTRSHKIGQLDKNAGQCEALCLSNINKNDQQQYLFVICSHKLLHMYCVSTGEQMNKIYIDIYLDPFLGILNDRLLLKFADRLCIIKIIDRKSLPPKSTDAKCPLFEQTSWLKCHDCYFA